MNPSGQKLNLIPRRRRYVVHLYYSHEESSKGRRYIARIQPWTARNSSQAETYERSFADECELIEIINPLLPPGSDVRDVLSHIESPDGFLYLLHLSSEEAGRLGWQSKE